MVVEKNTIVKSDACTGCGACANICPPKAIALLPDEKGFYIPQINEGSCFDCGLCKKVCPIGRKKELETPDFAPEVYAAYAKDEYIRRESSSGGVFSVLAQHVLNNKGVIYGAAFDANFKVVHIGIRKTDSLAELRGSKYVQSFIREDLFIEIKSELEKGTLVLFSGTPCQVAGLKLYLQKSYSNLLLVDLICHGVPSPFVFAEYLKYLENQYGKIVSYKFRDKNKSWKIFNSKVLTKSKSIIKYMGQDLFLFLFLFHTQPFLRESCYHCAFAERGRVSDLTLGDFWGYNAGNNVQDDDKGLSCVICNTPLGWQIFQTLSSELKYEKRCLDEAEQGNPVLKSPVKGKEEARKQFWNIFLSGGFPEIKKVYFKQAFRSRASLFIRMNCGWLYNLLRYIYRIVK